LFQLLLAAVVGRSNPTGGFFLLSFINWWAGAWWAPTAPRAASSSLIQGFFVALFIPAAAAVATSGTSQRCSLRLWTLCCDSRSWSCLATTSAGAGRSCRLLCLIRRHVRYL